MKAEEIKTLFTQFETTVYEIEGVECWSARSLQSILGYSKWENFDKVIQKAKIACENVGEEVTDHFPNIRKMIPLAKGAHREVKNISLTW